MNVSFWQYFTFQKRIIAMYVIIMSFITIMLYIEPTMSVHISNVLYMNAVSLGFFLSYLAIDYFYIKKHFTKIMSHWNDGIYIPEGIGAPKTYEQHLYRQWFQTINEQHQQKMVSITQEKKESLEFMTSWFHEIKTPIAVCKLILEQSSNYPDSQSIQEEISRIERNVEQALYFTRSDHFTQDYHISQIELDKVVRTVVKQHAKQFIQRKIRADLQIESIQVETDSKWVGYILSEVLSNALKYSLDEGTISIHSEEDKKEVRLTITDNGIGISQADLPRVFHLGFTGSNGRIHHKSTGMGLYLAKKLTTKMGHELSITSQENQYTTITIHFPKRLDYYAIVT
ncbi:sensor histidine kinase [Sporosarcina sp. Sa2YVA2]|uniref:histidine kinase n=1 Tax=Sporosarcina quadrami TaxID=2762234 RepID=A0ABR8UBJ4_9BACL|nr:sensor histidine kinase [Sporosarcina quadrami]MBD7985381.1 sensor histidine kinase [Sporosarcina quadrami]